MNIRSSFYMVCGLAVIIASVVLLLHRKQSLTAYTADELRYYQAVYVLQNQVAEIGGEKETIPPAIQRHDSTHALMHHPDRIFTLHQLAQTLEGLPAAFSRAPLYAAQARRALGQHHKAMDLLSRHVAEAPYEAYTYELLCDSARQASDYAFQYLIATEWEEKDPRCAPAQLMCNWSALYNLQRYEDATSLMLQKGSCLGMQADLYAARAAAAFGDILLAEYIITSAQYKYPASQEHIQQMWERLRASVNVEDLSLVVSPPPDPR